MDGPPYRSPCIGRRETALQAFNKEVALLEHTTRTKCASVKHRCEQERAAYATVHAEIGACVVPYPCSARDLTMSMQTKAWRKLGLISRS